MNMFDRVLALRGKCVRVRTKSGDTHEGTLEKVDDGEIILKPPFGNTVFMGAEQIENISADMR